VFRPILPSSGVKMFCRGNCCLGCCCCYISPRMRTHVVVSASSCLSWLRCEGRGIIALKTVVIRFIILPPSSGPSSNPSKHHLILVGLLLGLILDAENGGSIRVVIWRVGKPNVTAPAFVWERLGEHPDSMRSVWPPDSFMEDAPAFLIQGRTSSCNYRHWGKSQ
jgi:hypothetical protein